MCQERRSRRGYLEDVEGSWSETWRTGSSMMSRRIFFTPRKIPWNFLFDIFFRSLSGMGVEKGGTWRMLRVPDRRLGGQVHRWCYPREDTLKVLCWYLYGKYVRNVGIKKVDTWRTLRVPDQTNGRWGHPRCHELYFFTLRYLQSKNRVALLEVIPKEFCAP